MISTLNRKPAKTREEAPPAKSSIRIRPPELDYPALFRSEKSAIERNLRHLKVLTLEHIGSTAVNGLGGQNVVDILLVVPKFTKLGTYLKALATLGYLWKDAERYHGQSLDVAKPERIHLSRKDGQVKFHLHLEQQGAPKIADLLDFRNYLRANPIEAEKYYALKTKWAAAATKDWKKYSALKSEYVKDCLEKFRRPSRTPNVDDPLGQP